MDDQIEAFAKTSEHIVPNAEQVERIACVRDAVKDLVYSIGQMVPEPSAERTIALRKLEEARMYAIFAIVTEDKR